MYRAFSLTWPAAIQIYWNKRKRLLRKKSSTPTVFVWNINIAAVLLFWDTNMAAVTSSEDTLLLALIDSLRDILMFRINP